VSVAEELAQRVCSLGWSISSAAAAAVIHTQVALYMPASTLQLRSLVWLQAAAMAAPEQDALLDYQLDLRAVLITLKLLACKDQQQHLDDGTWDLLSVLGSIL
jgi:hypothetical protein